MDKKIIEIDTEYIKLDSFLKYVGIAETGGQAKHLVTDSKVLVNGEICLMRGKKLHNKDQVVYNGKLYEVSAK